MPESFPRSKDLPSQSPLFWVTHKDRYLRQLLIQDIEAQTDRDLLVYFTDCDHSDAQIDPTDDTFLNELLEAASRPRIDLLLETNGGQTDATEKICALLRAKAPDLRVIVPRRAKSNGTVIALCGSHIVMSSTSELGPIDPSIGGVPVEFVINAPAGAVNPIEMQIALTFKAQTQKLAKQLLLTGMLAGGPPNKIDEIVGKLASRDHYHSHGSVIDVVEAKALGLAVVEVPSTDELWRRIWLLRTMYSYDANKNGHSKIFEGARISSAVTRTQKPA
jgi:ATP-dependent protease ClpP protease subunit